MDDDLQRRLKRIFTDAFSLSQNMALPTAIEHLQRHLAEAEEVLEENRQRRRLKPNFGG